MNDYELFMRANVGHVANGISQLMIAGKYDDAMKEFTFLAQGVALCYCAKLDGDTPELRNMMHDLRRDRALVVAETLLSMGMDASQLFDCMIAGHEDVTRDEVMEIANKVKIEPPAIISFNEIDYFGASFASIIVSMANMYTIDDNPVVVASKYDVTDIILGHMLICLETWIEEKRYPGTHTLSELREIVNESTIEVCMVYLRNGAKLSELREMLPNDIGDRLVMKVKEETCQIL